MADVPSDYQLDPAAVATQQFPVVRKGYKREAVSGYLLLLSQEVRRLEAAVETERLGIRRLERMLEEAEAGGTPGEKARSLIAEAEDSATRAIRDAERRADEILAEARREADEIRAQAERETRASEGQLERQAVTVREKLRQEVRKVRAEVARECDELRRKAEDEAALIRSAAGSEGEFGAILEPAAAEEIASRILQDAEDRHQQAVTALERQRAALEAQTGALRLVHDSLADGLAEAREQLRGMLVSLETVADLDVLDMTVIDESPRRVDAGDAADAGAPGAGPGISTQDVQSDDVHEQSHDSPASPPAVAVERDAASHGEAEADEGETTANASPTRASQAGGSPTDSRDDEAVGDRVGKDQVKQIWHRIPDTPDDDQIDALFERIVSQRHGDPLTEAQSHELAASDEPEAMSDADDSDAWGYIESEPPDTPEHAGSVGGDAVTKQALGAGADEEHDERPAETPDVTPPSSALVDHADRRPAVGESLEATEKRPAPRVDAEKRTRLRAVFSSLASDSSDGESERVEVPSSLPAAGDNSRDRGQAPTSDLEPGSGPSTDAEPGHVADVADTPVLIDATTVINLRDRAVSNASPAVGRKIKRALQEIENDFLDALRSEREPALDSDQLADVFAAHLAPAVVKAVETGVGDAPAHIGVQNPDMVGVAVAEQADAVIRATLGDWLDTLAGEIRADPEACPALLQGAREDAAELAQSVAAVAHSAGLIAAGRVLSDAAGYRFVGPDAADDQGVVLAFDDGMAVPSAAQGGAVALVPDRSRATRVGVGG